MKIHLYKGAPEQSFTSVLVGIGTSFAYIAETSVIEKAMKVNDELQQCKASILHTERNPEICDPLPQQVGTIMELALFGSVLAVGIAASRVSANLMGNPTKITVVFDESASEKISNGQENQQNKNIRKPGFFESLGLR